MLKTLFSILTLGILLNHPFQAIAQELGAGGYLPATLFGEPTHFYHFYFQDSKGFIWGTRDIREIIRYDGSDFAIFAPDDNDTTSFSGCRLSSNWVSFLEDRDGQLWIRALEGCLDRFNPETGRFERLSPQIRRQFPEAEGMGLIDGMMEDRQGNIWIAATQMGAIKFDWESREWHRFSAEGAILAILEDNNGHIWGCVEARNGDLIMSKLNERTKRFEPQMTLPFPERTGVLPTANRSNQVIRLGNTSSFCCWSTVRSICSTRSMDLLPSLHGFHSKRRWLAGLPE